jgi:hypothetical protein
MQFNCLTCAPNPGTVVFFMPFPYHSPILFHRSVRELQGAVHPLGRFVVDEVAMTVVAGEEPQNGEAGGINAWDLRRTDRPAFRITTMDRGISHASLSHSHAGV